MEVTALTKVSCYHCGEPCSDYAPTIEEKVFCCEGCKTVYEVLSTHELGAYYTLDEATPGTSLKGKATYQDLDWLDDPAISSKLLLYQDENVSRVSFSLPQIHCSSCIWLLENLPKLHPGIHSSRVNFLRKNCSIQFYHAQIKLGELVYLLRKIGYDPDLTLQDLTKASEKRTHNQDLFRLAVAGFCFGNIMLLSFPEYLSVGSLESQFASFFGYLNVGLSLPVMLYSAQGYGISAWKSIRKGYLNIDVPITLGILTLFIRSCYEIAFHLGPGYLDSLAGLVFFLLLGRWYQNKAYARLRFDREYGDYFPITVLKEGPEGEQYVPATQLEPGDIIRIKNEELIPADGILLSSHASVDYSFVTGESDPVVRKKGDILYAGGRQMGTGIRLQLSKRTQQSYLTQLWEGHANTEPTKTKSLTDLISRRFTPFILLIALGAGLYWYVHTDAGTALNILSAVLIIACPCALALSAPITLGQSLRVLGRNRCFVKNTDTLERMAQVNHLVFDKTGTLTTQTDKQVHYQGSPLSPEMASIVRSLTRESQHPVSKAIGAWVGAGPTVAIEDFREVPGKGIQGNYKGKSIFIGSASFLETLPLEGKETIPTESGYTHWGYDEGYRGSFYIPSVFRPGWEKLIEKLKHRMALSVLSGDSPKDLPYLKPHFHPSSQLKFEQSPFDKQGYIQTLQQEGETVLMMGDGLNDSGSLRQAEVGIALTDSSHNFTPASDAILEEDQFLKLDSILTYASQSVKLVYVSYGLSFLYNVVGISIAVQGHLSPLIAAILMPASSLSVVILGTFGSRLLAKYLGLEGGKTHSK